MGTSLSRSSSSSRKSRAKLTCLRNVSRALKALSRARREKAALKSLLVFSGKKGRASWIDARLYSGSSIDEDEEDEDDVEEEEDEAVDMAVEDEDVEDEQIAEEDDEGESILQPHKPSAGA